MDRSTDKGKVENEVIVIQYCRVDEAVEEVRLFSRFLTVVEPVKADADGLIKCLGEGLKEMEITGILNSKKVLEVEGQPVLIGEDTDGGTVNISDHNGMKGKLQHALPWLFWSWCFSHCLELACKDSLSTQSFKDVEGMLLKLYYLYEKSSKKCRNWMTLLVIWKKCSSYLREELTCEKSKPMNFSHKEMHYNVSLVAMVLTLITWQL